jgi:hypothetical protein
MSIFPSNKESLLPKSLPQFSSAYYLLAHKGGGNASTYFLICRINERIKHKNYKEIVLHGEGRHRRWKQSS